MNKNIFRLTKKTKLCLIIAVIFIAVISSILVLENYFTKMLDRRLQEEEQQAMDFLEQIIESVNNQTDFYKKKAFAPTIKDVERYKDKFSDDYEIEIIDSDLGHHAYNVTFNQEYRFHIYVVGVGNGFTFMISGPPTEKIDWSLEEY